MKKILTIIVVMFFSTLFASAEGFRLGGSLGYYSMADSIFKNTYGSGNFMYGGSLSYDLMKNIEIRGEISYFKDKGEMTLTKEEIKFSIIPIVIGMRYKLVEIKKLSPYLGVGLDFFSYKEKARIGNTSDSTTGFHVEGGSYITLGRRFHIDLNLRYTKADDKPYDEKIKLGGLRAGIGVGFSF